jgi:hypothetical protein
MAVAALFAASAVLLLFMHFIQENTWKLLHDDAGWSSAVRLSMTLGTVGWISLAAAEIASFAMLVFGLAAWRRLTWTSRWITLIYFIPALLGALAAALFLMLLNGPGLVAG